MSKTIVIDVGSQQIRLLEADARGSRVRVERLASIAVPEGGEGSDRDAVRARVQAALQGTTGSGIRVLGLVGRSQAVLRDLRLPDVPADEMPHIVQLQAMRELSFPVEQAAIDFDVVGAADEEGQRRVTVAAIHREVIDRYRAVVGSVQFELSRLGLRPYATWRAYRQMALVPDGAVMVLSLSGDALELTVARGDSVLLSRATMLRGGEGKPEGAGRVPALVAEVRRTSAAFANQLPNVPIERIALAAGRDEHAELASALAAGTSLPVDRFDPFDAVDLGRELARSGAATDDRGSFVAAIGAAVAHNEAWAIDFLNPKKPVVKRDRRKPIAVLAGTAAALVVASAYAAVQIQLARGRANIERLTTRHTDLQDKLKGATEIVRRHQAVEQWIKSETDCLEELRRITEQYPDTREMYTTFMQISRDTSADRPVKIVLDVVARQQTAGSEFNTKLNTGDEYRAQPIGQVQSEKRGNDYLWRFSSSIVRRAQEPDGGGSPSDQTSTDSSNVASDAAPPRQEASILPASQRKLKEADNKSDPDAK